jgi:hypothetical protein
MVREVDLIFPQRTTRTVRYAGDVRSEGTRKERRKQRTRRNHRKNGQVAFERRGSCPRSSPPRAIEGSKHQASKVRRSNHRSINQGPSIKYQASKHQASKQRSIRVQASSIKHRSIRVQHPSIEASGSKHQVSKHQGPSIEASGSSIQASKHQVSKHQGPSIKYQVSSIEASGSSIQASSIKHRSIRVQVSSIEASGSKHQVSSIEASGSSIQASSIKYRSIRVQASKHQGPASKHRSIRVQASKHQGPASKHRSIRVQASGSKHQVSSIEASGSSIQASKHQVSKHQGPSIEASGSKHRSIKYRSIEGSKHQVIPPCSTSAPCPLHERVPRWVRPYVLDDRPTGRPTLCSVGRCAPPSFSSSDVAPYGTGAEPTLYTGDGAARVVVGHETRGWRGRCCTSGEATADECTREKEAAGGWKREFAEGCGGPRTRWWWRRCSPSSASPDPIEGHVREPPRSGRQGVGCGARFAVPADRRDCLRGAGADRRPAILLRLGTAGRPASCRLLLRLCLAHRHRGESSTSKAGFVGRPTV